MAAVDAKTRSKAAFAANMIIDALAPTNLLLTNPAALLGEESALAISAMCYTMQGSLSRARAALDAMPASSVNQVTIAFGATWGSIVGAGDERG